MNIGSKVDPARKMALDVVQIRNLFFGIIFSIIFIVMGFAIGNRAGTRDYTPVEAEVTNATAVASDSTYTIDIKYTVDGKEYTDKIDLSTSQGNYAKGNKVTVYIDAGNPGSATLSKNGSIGYLFAVLFIGIGGLVLIGTIVSSARWYSKRGWERQARANVFATAEPDGEPMGEYTFKTTYQEKLNQLMADDTKKFGVVTEHWSETFLMRDDKDEVVYEAQTPRHMSVFPVSMRFFNRKTGAESMHKLHFALFAPTGLSVGLGKAGRLYTNFGIANTVEMMVDGKRYWKDFYGDGYYFDRTFDGMRSIYSLKKNGVEIATVSDLSVGDISQRSLGVLNKVSAIGQYKITCREKDLDTIFMFCMLLANAHNRHATSYSG